MERPIVAVSLVTPVTFVGDPGVFYAQPGFAHLKREIKDEQLIQMLKSSLIERELFICLPCIQRGVTWAALRL